MNIHEMSTDQLEQEIQRFEVVRRQAAAVMGALIAEVDRRQVPLGDGCRSTREWVAGRIDTTPEEASGLTRLSLALQDLPETSDRFAKGELSVARALLISRVATAESEADWFERLARLNLAGAERLVARHRRLNRKKERAQHRTSWVSIQPSLDEAWWRLSGGVGSVAGHIISTALRDRADELPSGSGDQTHRQALALESLCQDAYQSEGSEPSITAFVDLDAARGSDSEAGADVASGPRLGPDALAELLCNGRVQVVGLSNGRPVTATPNSRTIPPAVRRFVLWRDGGACQAAGCTSTYRLQPHHIHGWQNGHDPDGLVTLCWYHHHVVVHRRGYRIERDQAGIYFRAPADSRDPPR